MVKYLSGGFDYSAGCLAAQYCTSSEATGGEGTLTLGSVLPETYYGRGSQNGLL